MVNVLVVDEHPVLREGLRSVLGKEPDLAVVGEASSGEEACAEVERTSPDVAVVGVRIRGSNGMGIARALVARYPELRVVILTSFANNAVLRGVFSIGAHGVVVKESDQSVLRHAVKAVGAGVQFIDPCLEMAASFAGAQARSTEADAYGLTETERQVLSLLPRGMSNAQIAELLDLSPRTVATALDRAKRKLGVKNRAEAAAFVVRDRIG
ncbi:MAG: response regulator [Acidimicrobiales bacterium]